MVGGLLLGHQCAAYADLRLLSGSEAYLHPIVVTALAIYIFAAALPFVPAAEIGLGLMLILGPEIAPWVYASTVLALVGTYLVGRSVPARVCAVGFAFLGFNRSRDLVLELAALEASARLKFLLERVPARLPGLLRYRYLTLAVALNLPGNTLFGGGGGIALAAGMSGLYPMPAYLMTVAIAVAPVPLVIALSELLP